MFCIKTDEGFPQTGGPDESSWTFTSTASLKKLAGHLFSDRLLRLTLAFIILQLLDGNVGLEPASSIKSHKHIFKTHPTFPMAIWTGF
jgi:hypothetical protein